MIDCLIFINLIAYLPLVQPTENSRPDLELNPGHRRSSASNQGRPGGETSRQGAKRLGGETARGRNVQLPLILSLRPAHDQNTEASRGRKAGTVYRTRSQSTSRYEGAPSAPLAGLGAPEPKTILLLSKTDRMPILDRELDRVGCYRHCTSPT